jgi:inner membrane protein
MMAKTHLLLAATVTSMVLETTHPIVLGTAALASQLPDVDTSTSFAGRLCLPLARWLEYRFAHRTVTHSFLATVFIALLAWPLRSHSAQLWAAFILGYFSGWFGDTFTKAGVAAFYPLSSARLVIPANPRLRLTTGTRAEYVVLALLLIALLGSIHLNSKGGLLRGVNVWLAQPEGVAALFARESTRHQILAHITGRLVASAQLTQEEFEVLEVEGERLLVRNRQGQRFWAGHTQTCPTCHLDIHRVQARIGHVIAIATHELRWQDEELSKVVGGRWSVVGEATVVGGQWSVAGNTTVVGGQWLVIGKNTPSSPATDLRQPATNHRPPATSSPPPATSHLPCSDSSPTCLNTLGDLAVENSREIAVLEQAIAVQKKKRWTSWLNADGLNPLAIGLRIARNVVGGGERAALQLELARLELRRAELATNLRQTITQKLLEYEAAEQECRRAEARLTTHQTRLALLPLAYRLGEGSTEVMLQLWQTQSELQYEVAAAQTLLRQRQTQLHSLVFPRTP